MARGRLLLVDDDDLLREDLAKFFTEQNYDVATANNVAAARELLGTHQPEICMLDIRMPGASGKVLCRELAENSDIGVIMMSSLSDSETVISLLEIGADDYIVKPFRFDEALARLRALARRRSTPQPRPAASPTDQIGDWSFDFHGKRLSASGGVVRRLTQSEAEILRFLSASPNTVFSREDLLAVARTRQHAGKDDRSVDALIKRLRKKLEADPAEPRYVVTVWGRGYRFDP